MPMFIICFGALIGFLIIWGYGVAKEHGKIFPSKPDLKIQTKSIKRLNKFRQATHLVAQIIQNKEILRGDPIPFDQVLSNGLAESFVIKKANFDCSVPGNYSFKTENFVYSEDKTSNVKIVARIDDDPENQFLIESTEIIQYLEANQFVAFSRKQHVTVKLECSLHNPCELQIKLIT